MNRLETYKDCKPLVDGGKCLVTRDSSDDDYLTHLYLWQDAIWEVRERKEDYEDAFAVQLSVQQIAVVTLSPFRSNR